MWLNNPQCNSVISRLLRCISCLHCRSPHCQARALLQQQQSCPRSGTAAYWQVTHIICVGSLLVGRDRWIFACAIGQRVPNGFTLQKVMACHRLRPAKHNTGVHAFSGSRMGASRKRVRRVHVEQQQHGRKGPPLVLASPDFSLSLWHGPKPRKTGPLLSQLARGLLDSQQLAQQQFSHLGQAAVLPA